ncbi:YfbK domain-containing protein [Tautonia sp. JC769]|uniref:YfbK domain-containing protein n=1 Tax=Tautonia sp. JC769 TaxID=3232135 RepID=UPI00345B36F9
MTFDPDDPKLTAFALGELDEADRRSVESLLASSPEAARFVAEVRETAALLSDTLRKEPMPGLSIVQRLDLDARIGAVGPPSTSLSLPEPTTSRRFPVRRALVAVAASVFLAMSGFGIGVLVTARELSNADRTVAFTPSEAPGAIGAAAEPDRKDARLAAPRPVEPSSEAPETEADASMGMEGMMARSNAVASDESSEMQPDQLGMESVLPESPQEFARSLPSRAKEAEPRSEAGAMAPSSVVAREAPRDQAEAADGVVAGRLDKDQRGGFPGLRGGGAGVGLGGRQTTDQAEEAPEAPAPEPSMIPPPAPLFDTSRERRGVDRALGNPASAVVGTPGIERSEGAKASQALAVQPGNVVEVLNLPDGTPAQRFALGEPIREVLVDPSGSRLLASTADRSLAVFDLRSGLLTNEFQVDRGPVPVARFGQGGELILSNLEAGGDRGGEDAVGFLWFQTQLEPVAAVPVDPGRVSIPELGRRIELEGIPVGPEFLTGSLVNTPAYPYDPPEAGEPLAVDVGIVPSPWSEGNRLVRLALIAGEAAPDDADAMPPVVVEEVTAEVEFNPARVARYRPIGFEARPLTLARIGEEPQVLRAGESSTVLFEVEPRELPGGPTDTGPRRAGRYQRAPSGVGDDELLTVSVAYREPGEGERRSVTTHVVDAPTPIDEAPDDVRLAIGLGWIGLLIQGMIDGDRATLDRIEALVGSTDEGFLPDVHADLERLLPLLERRLEQDHEAIP